MSKFAFLGSTRFWAMIVGAVTMYAQTKGYIGDPEAVLIETIMGGFIAVRTVDRAFEKSGSVDTGKPPIEHY